MKIDIDPETQNMVQNVVAVCGLIAIVIVSLVVLKLDAKEIALTLGGGLVGFLGGAKMASPKKSITG